MTLRIKGSTVIKGLTSVGWSPNLLFAAGEQGVWYDPSDFTTMFQDDAGTTPVTATGQSVGRILDKSGRGNHATQATPANRPTLQIDGNGKYYLSFDGSNDSLATSASFLSSIGAFTSVVGFLVGSVANNNGIFSAVASIPTTDILYGVQTDSKALFQVNNGADGGGTDPAARSTTKTYVDTLVFDGSQSTPANRISMRSNGASITYTASGATPPTTTPNLATQNFLVGSYNSLSGWWLSGRFYGLIIRASTCTASQIAMAETYMNGKTAAY